MPGWVKGCIRQFIRLAVDLNLGQQPGRLIRKTVVEGQDDGHMQGCDGSRFSPDDIKDMPVCGNEETIHNAGGANVAPNRLEGQSLEKSRQAYAQLLPYCRCQQFVQIRHLKFRRGASQMFLRIAQRSPA